MSTYTKSGIRLPSPSERRPSVGRRRFSPTMAIGAVMNPDGTVAWQDTEWQTNALIDEGERDMLAVYLGAQTNPSKYLCLINGTTTAPVETSTMLYLGGGAGANETQVPGANGYNREWTGQMMD
jgi:hypothetical protein